MDAKRKALTVFIGFTALAFLIFNANQAGPVSYKYTQPAMGTIFNVTVYGAPENDARDASRKAFSLLHSIEAELSRFRDDSELSAVNKLPASSHKISGHFLDCVKQSVAVGDLTDGYFDITFLPLYKAWDWRNDPKNEPSAATLEVLLKSVGYKKINLDEKGSTISLMPGMMLDLGGVAKGYSVVKMAESLQSPEQTANTT
ncbi:MAG TPA: FAD:protein FMN transferase, partial [Candidatus Wallbacteria bacterium]|nr:FAD:protein FMN transferase [Candidatus Wallbacteria bacterium]